MDQLSLLVFLLFVLPFGCAVGSFLNVVAYRLPAGLSLVSPPSRCPHCFHRLGNTENVPVLGWLGLKGRCRWCRAPISPRYPLVEAFTGGLFAFIFWRYGWQWQTPGYWLLTSFLIALTLIDWDTMTLPSSLTKSGLVAGLVFQAVVGWQQQQMVPFLVGAIAAGVLGIWGFDLMRVGGSLWLGQEGMGDGDPKLAALLGVWLGWPLLLLTTILACFFGVLYGGLQLALGGLKRRQGFPFGPFLAIAGLVSLFWGDALIAVYLDLVFPPL